MAQTSSIPLSTKIYLALYTVFGVYAFIGGLNFCYFTLLKRIDCVTKSGVYGLWCDTGTALSDTLLIVAWPAFWF